MRKKIGECLIQSGLITEQDLLLALAEHQRTGERVGTVIVRLGLATDKQVTKALAYQLGFPYVSLSDDPPERSAIVLIAKDVALKRVCIAVRLEKNLLTVAMSDPLLYSLVQDLEFQTGYQIKQVVATRADILDAIESGYLETAIARHAGRGVNTGLASPVGNRPARSTDVVDGTVMYSAADDVVEPAVPCESRGEDSESTPIADLVDLVIKGAIASGASDVHIEPMEKGVLVRHRFDGLLKEVMDLPKWVQDGLVDRIKNMSGMDIDEKRLPQEGRLRIQSDDASNVEFRVFTLRTLFGEKIALRVLDHRKCPPPLEELGLSATAMEDVREFLRYPHGMILVVGPASSGKTTTLSSMASALRSGRTNITTIEDPIEYLIPGINQTRVHEKAKLTFASSLRAILRQDTDVVVLGEMPDQETAKMAAHAAQTGCLLLSSLHTDDAPSAVMRLIDLAIEPYVIGSALVGVVAQRLVRRLCLACRRQYTPEAEMLRTLSMSEDAAQVAFYKAVGCEECSHTGYRGRIALCEVMRVNDRMRRLIAQRAGEDLIRDAAVEGGMISLGEDGLGKVKAGITTAEELLRVVTEVREMRALCPACSCAVGIDFRVCPACGQRLGVGCPRCARALQPGWSFCPYCSSDAVSKKKKKSKEHKPSETPSNVAEFKNQNR